MQIICRLKCERRNIRTLYTCFKIISWGFTFRWTRKRHNNSKVTSRFFVANHSITPIISSDFLCSRETPPTPSIVPFTLPTCFRYNRDENDNVESYVGNKRPIYLFYRENIIDEIMKLDTSILASVYAKFFENLWKKGLQLQLMSKSTVCSRLTPPYLKKPVLFMYRPRQSCSLPFLLRTLPNMW